MSTQSTSGQFGPQHRTALALGLVIGIVLGAIGAGITVFIMTRGTDTADVSDTTLDARAACDVLDRTTNDDLRAMFKQDKDAGESTIPPAFSRLVAAQQLAEAAAADNDAYQPLATHIRDGFEVTQRTFAFTPEAEQKITAARDFCDAH